MIQILCDEYTSFQQRASPPQFKFAPVHIGFIFPRSSEHAELRRQFNSVLDQLSQSGLLDKEFTTLGDKVGGT